MQFSPRFLCFINFLELWAPKKLSEYEKGQTDARRANGDGSKILERHWVVQPKQLLIKLMENRINKEHRTSK